jgi:hypothetical protein
VRTGTPISHSTIYALGAEPPRPSVGWFPLVPSVRFMLTHRLDMFAISKYYGTEGPRIDQPIYVRLARSLALGPLSLRTNNFSPRRAGVHQQFLTSSARCGTGRPLLYTSCLTWTITAEDLPPTKETETNFSS